MATSCLFHLVLAGAIVFLGPTAERPMLALRVRLTEDAHPRSQNAEPAPAPHPIARQKAPPPKGPDPVTYQPPPVHVSSSVPMPVVAEKETPVPTVSPVPPLSTLTPERPLVVAAEPLGNARGAGDGGRPIEEMDGRNGSGGGGRAGGGDAGGSPARGVAEPASGVFTISAGSGKGPLGFGDGTGSGSGGSGYGEGTGKGTAPGHGGGSGSGIGDGTGSGLADLLGAIRRQIERAKVYPETARRQHQQGTVELRFRITPDGLVEAVEVVRSSGHQILDDSSTQTVHRAAPYPPVGGWVRIPLSYRLER